MLKKGKYLITTDGWFIAPDGEQYRAVWGECEAVMAKDGIGFTPTRSTNWYLKVGTGDGSIAIAGCQIHYAVECLAPPKVIDHTFKQTETERMVTVNAIYFPNGR